MRAFRLTLVLTMFSVAFGVVYGWLNSPNWVFDLGYLVGSAIIWIPVIGIVFFAFAPITKAALDAAGYRGNGLTFGMLIKTIAVVAFVAWMAYRMCS